MSLDEREKNALATELSERLKDQVINMLGLDLLDAEDPEAFTSAATVSVEAGFLLLSNIGALMIMRLVASGMPMDDAKAKIKEIFGAYLDDTVRMAGERVIKVEEMLQGILKISKHRGH